MRQIQIHIITLIFFIFIPLQANSVALNEDKKVDAHFDVESANHQFDQIALKLSTINLDPKTLNLAIEQLNGLAKQANQCVQETGDKLSDLESQIKNIFGDASKKLSGVDSKYLENQRTNITQEQAKCRLFLLRANEALQVYRTTSLSLQQEITFTQGENALQRIQQIPDNLTKISLPALDHEEIDNALSCTIYSVPIFIIAFILSWRLKTLMHKKWRNNILNLMFNTVVLFLGFICIANLVIVQTSFIKLEDNMLFRNTVLIALLYLFLTFLCNLIFTLRLPYLFKRYGVDFIFLKHLFIAALTIYFIRVIGLNLLAFIHAPTNLTQLYEDLILISSLSAMMYFTLLLYFSHSNGLKKHRGWSLLPKLIGLIIMVLLTLDFVGYSILAVNSAYIFLSLLLVCTLGTVLFTGVSKAYLLIAYNPKYLYHLKKIFGYSGEPPFVELILLKIISQIVIIVSMVFLFAHLTGQASYFIDIFFNHLIVGFNVGGISIVPVQWLLGIIAFCLFSLLSRRVATKITRSLQYGNDDEEKQVAFASIVLYAGFAFSFIVGLLLAGFSFTNLAIIAGALSVGIGLGLQSIVTNFFSGLILLIEKPIKVGDRIKIDNIEGVVKKVSVRSTQIVTPAQEDIIIPNSDLITHQVTNYMFTDKFLRVKCSLGIAYGSDTEKVRQVMIDVAMSHPEVVKNSLNKPVVLFRSFGESALLFELWCLIKDGNKKHTVSSDLNFLLDKACRENSISIAFPQRDVHISFNPDQVPWVKKKDEF